MSQIALTIPIARFSRLGVSDGRELLAGLGALGGFYASWWVAQFERRGLLPV
jgi:hypothetical protein